MSGGMPVSVAVGIASFIWRGGAAGVSPAGECWVGDIANQHSREDIPQAKGVGQTFDEAFERAGVYVRWHWIDERASWISLVARYPGPLWWRAWRRSRAWWKHQEQAFIESFTGPQPQRGANGENDS